MIRLMNSVYQAEKVEVREGRAFVLLEFGGSFLQHPEPVKPDGQIGDQAKVLLTEAVQSSAKRTGLRMCLVWGSAWCSFVEPDGSIKNSFHPPSGGVHLPARTDPEDHSSPNPLKGEA